MYFSPRERLTLAVLATPLCFLAITHSTSVRCTAQVSSPSTTHNDASPSGDGASPKSGTVSLSTLRVPAKAHHEFEKARPALERNDHADARKHIEAALRIAPDFATALAVRAYLELTANQIEAAIEDLEHAIRADPGYPFSYLVMGAVMNRLGRFDDALRNLDRAFEIQPLSWNCAFEMSQAWLGKRDYAKALLHVNRAFALGRHSKLPPVLHVVRGEALAGLQNYEQATKEFQAYLSAEPNGPFVDSARKSLAQIKSSAPYAPAKPPVIFSVVE